MEIEVSVSLVISHLENTSSKRQSNSTVSHSQNLQL